MVVESPSLVVRYRRFRLVNQVQPKVFDDLGKRVDDHLFVGLFTSDETSAACQTKSISSSFFVFFLEKPNFLFFHRVAMEEQKQNKGISIK